MCYSGKLGRLKEKATGRSQVHRGDAVEREESEPDASRVRLLAFFPSRATGSSGKEDDDVVRLSLSLSRSPSTSPPVSHDGSLRLPDLLRVPTRRGFPNGISLRCKYTTSPFCFFSFDVQRGLLVRGTSRGACFNICTRMRERGHARLLHVCVTYPPVRMEASRQLPGIRRSAS